MYKLGLIGYPVSHSLSPWIHERFLQKAGLDGSYSLFEIHPDRLAEELAHLKEAGVNGFNVTVPHKSAIIPYLDEIDEEAEKMGAVNTVLNQGGKWIGYNTDGSGYVRSLKHYYPLLFSDKSKPILLLGAGGAARGIYYALMREGFTHIDIANRTEASAEAIQQLATKDVQTNVLSLQKAEEKLELYAVVIHTTSVGMTPKSSEMIISLAQLKTITIVSDIVYQPIMTKLLSEAKTTGASIHFGHTMLLYQAQHAFEIWTGKKVELGKMAEQLQETLEG